MRERIKDSAAAKTILSPTPVHHLPIPLACPYCNQPCDRIEANQSGSRVIVQKCKEHGKMKIANVYTDEYMTKQFPDLEKRGTQWVPRVDGLPLVEDL